MPDSNEAVARRSIEAWSADDWALLESQLAPDARIRGPESWPEAGAFHGWPAIRGQFERLKEPWSDERAEVVAAESAGEQVLLRVRWRGHGGESGLELDMELWNVYTVAGGRIVEILFNLDEESARADFGAP